MRRVHFPGFSAIPALALAALLAGGGLALAADMSNLTFTGDASFHGPHGGQPIHVAVVDSTTHKVVAEKSGTVSKTAEPSFSFTFPGVLQAGKNYEVDYWIDSNFGGGTLGVCDAKQHDHQWRVKLGKVTGDVFDKVVVVTHQPAKTTSVCSVFKKM